MLAYTIFFLLSLQQLFADPKLDHLYRYFQAGSVAAYEHIAMIKSHYSMADALDECLAKLSSGKIALRERASVNFKPLRAQDEAPPPISVEDVPNVTPRVAKIDGAGNAVSSYESLTTDDDDDDDESNWLSLQ